MFTAGKQNFQDIGSQAWFSRCENSVYKSDGINQPWIFTIFIILRYYYKPYDSP